MQQKIVSLFCTLGITPNYKGFFYMGYALLLVCEDARWLQKVTQRLYPQIAERYHTTASCVERDLRWVIHVAWNRNPHRLIQLAQRALHTAPTTVQMLSMLNGYLCAQENKSAGVSAQDAFPRF